MAQNALLFSNISKQNKTSNLTTDIINLNKINNISFGGIGEWKKWINKNPLHKSIWQLQLYTALGTAAAVISKNLGLVTSSVISGCQSTKNASCDNYKEYDLKDDLNISPATNCLISAIVEMAINAAKTKSNGEAATIGASTTLATCNPIIGTIAGLGVKFAQDAKAKAIVAATIIEAYGGAIIWFLENRHHKGGGPSGGAPGGGGDDDDYSPPPIVFDKENREKEGYKLGLRRRCPELYNKGHEHFIDIHRKLDSHGLILNYRGLKDFFDNLSPYKLKIYHIIYETYMEEYLPQNMDIKETYSIEVDKKTNKIYIYDKIENEIMCSMDNIPFDIENRSSESVQEATYSYTPSYSYKQYNYNSNRYNQNQGGMLC